MSLLFVAVSLIATVSELPPRSCAVDANDTLQIRTLRSESCKGEGSARCCARTEKISLWSPKNNVPVWLMERSLEGDDVSIQCQPGKVEMGFSGQTPVVFAYRGPAQPLVLDASVSRRVASLETSKPGAPGLLAEATSLVNGLRLVNSWGTSLKNGPKAGVAELAQAMWVRARELGHAGELDTAQEQLTELEELEALLPQGNPLAKRAETLGAELQKKKRSTFPLRILEKKKVGKVPMDAVGPPETEPNLFFHQGALCKTPGAGETTCFDPKRGAWAKRAIEAPIAIVQRASCAQDGCNEEGCLQFSAKATAQNETPTPVEAPMQDVLAIYSGGAIVLREGKLHVVSDVGFKPASAADIGSFLKDSPGSRLFGQSEYYADELGRVVRVSQPGTAWELPGDGTKATPSSLNHQFPTWRVLFASPDQSWVVVAKRQLEGTQAPVNEQELWLFRLGK